MVRPSALPQGFGRALKRLRIDLGLTQEELADRADLTPRYIRQLEGGHQSPTLTVVAALALALSRQPHELVRAAQEALELQ